MTEPQLPSGPAQRVSSGVTGLDTLLNGGWLYGGTYILTGSPGTGKTILGNEFCFSAVAGGGRAVYVTVLAESHGRMLQHLEPMRFFRPEVVGKSLHYISGYATLKAEGLAGLGRLLFKSVREYQATVLVVDGLSAVEESAESRLAFREFLHSLCVHNALAGCTSLLLTGTVENAANPQFAMVDGVVMLSAQLQGLKMVRNVEVQKFRGSAQIAGKHTFDITHDGLRIYPRTEALYARQPDVEPDPGNRLRFNVPRLDEMIGGGLVAYSNTLLFGSPGGGKTLLGLHFLAEGARKGESCLYYGFTETGPRLRMKASCVGLDLEPLVNSGRLRLEARVSVETLPDGLVQDLLGLVEQHRPQRLVLDGIEPFLRNESIEPQRSARFVTALTNELRARRVTVVMTQQSNNLFGPELNASLEGVEAIIDNIVFVRFVEMRSQFYRMISVMKMRESDNDPALRLFSVTSRGIHVEDAFESAEAVLTGQARPLDPKKKGKKPKRRSLLRRRSRS